MTVEEIKELIQVVNESMIAELEVQRGDNRVRIKRTNMAAPQEIVLAPATPGMMAVSSPGSLGQGGSGAMLSATPPGPTAEEEKLITVKSPIVGTFYESPSPDAPPFVKVGDRVTPGQVLCIIESMKLMNEIEAEVAGVIASRLVENAKPVEYGEALFTVQPV